MARLLIPLLLAVLGAGSGIGAGLYLRPGAEATTGGDGNGAGKPAGQDEDGAGDGGEVAAEDAAEAGNAGTDPMPDRGRPPIDQLEFVRMTNQFVVPVLRQGEVRSLVVVSIGVEVRVGLRDLVFLREPKLRDAFLRVMFDHANAGGFDGTFTSGPQMESLRRNLWEAARPILGADVFDVLITDIARQDT